MPLLPENLRQPSENFRRGEERGGGRGGGRGGRGAPSELTNHGWFFQWIFFVSTATLKKKEKKRKKLSCNRFFIIIRWKKEVGQCLKSTIVNTNSPLKIMKKCEVITLDWFTSYVWVLQQQVQYCNCFFSKQMIVWWNILCDCKFDSYLTFLKEIF